MSLYYIFISSSLCEAVYGLAHLQANLHKKLPITRVLRNVPILYLYFKFIPVSQFVAWLSYMLTYITYCP